MGAAPCSSHETYFVSSPGNGRRRRAVPGQAVPVLGRELPAHRPPKRHEHEPCACAFPPRAARGSRGRSSSVPHARARPRLGALRRSGKQICGKSRNLYQARPSVLGLKQLTFTKGASAIWSRSGLLTAARIVFVRSTASAITGTQARIYLLKLDTGSVVQTQQEHDGPRCRRSEPELVAERHSHRIHK
jgi:hypothetical protein